MDIKQAIESMTGKSFEKGAIKCPFHAEKTGSFKVKNNYYKCFGCGDSGDIITFIMKFNNIGFIEAIRFADQYFNTHILEEKITIKQQIEERKRKREIENRDKELKTLAEKENELYAELRICNEALRQGVFEPFSDTWCYYNELKMEVEKKISQLEIKKEEICKCI